MLNIRPFACVRPAEDMAKKTAALPYDVYNRKEAKAYVKDKPYSFLRIDRPETAFDEDFDMYSDEAYQKAKELLSKDIESGIYIKDNDEAYYIYELTMGSRSQNGIVACASIDDYAQNRIKKHENTRVQKELDRIRHIDTLSAQTGAIFLAYKSCDVLKDIIANKKKEATLYDFTSDDGVKHRVWKIADVKTIDEVKKAFAKMESAYIADGHHRASSAVKVGLERRNAENYVKDGESDYFLSVLFDEEELYIMPYNRVVKDLAGLDKAEFFEKLKSDFDIQKLDREFQPDTEKTFGMYIDKTWYKLDLKNKESRGIIEDLDVSILEDKVLRPVLNIQNTRTDDRIVFVGGIRGLKELEMMVDSGMAVAFSMYPTSIGELISVADAGLLMPAKSTWFEPKLMSGIFIHEI
jgi:hypothetical protein